MNKNQLDKNQNLQKGDYLTSKDGRWKAMLQHDGNLVIYGQQTVWESNTAGIDVNRLSMQEDSNLVMYDKDGTAKWHTNTYVPMPRPPHHGHRHDCHVELTDDGHLVLHRGPDKVWSSADSKGLKGN